MTPRIAFVIIVVEVLLVCDVLFNKSSTLPILLLKVGVLHAPTDPNTFGMDPVGFFKDEECKEQLSAKREPGTNIVWIDVPLKDGVVFYECFDKFGERFSRSVRTKAPQ
jgi:hypothetical protein